MKMKTYLFAAAATAMATMAFAEDAATPALIYDMGGKFDKSFNEGAFNGAEAYKEKTGGEYRDFEIQAEAQREQAVRRFAEDGNNPVVATGFAYSSILESVIPDYPDTMFVTIDGWVDPGAFPNILNVGFKEHEGSYLVGIMAAMASKSGTVGFVGGMDIPLIHKFGCGYAQGVKSVNADAKIIQNMTGTTASAWNDPVKGSELTKAQVEEGADVVYHAAGGTGVGVLQAAADAGILGIGVDSNQNGMHPGSVLTSMLKRVDNAVESVFTQASEGTLEGGVLTLGLAEGGVDVALDDNNKDLVSEEMLAAVEEAKAKIIAGEIVVHDYSSDNTCPVE